MLVHAISLAPFPSSITLIKLGIGGKMQGIVHGLAQNNYVLSIANLGGVIAFLVIIYGFARWVYRFARVAYDQNVRVAFYRNRRRRFVRAKRAALDLHIFIAMLVPRTMVILFAALAVINGMVAWSAQYSTPPQEKLSTLLHVAGWWDQAIGLLLLYAPLVLLLAAALSLTRLAVTTARVRTKLVKRKWRNAPDRQQSQ